MIGVLGLQGFTQGSRSGEVLNVQAASQVSGQVSNMNVFNPGLRQRPDARQLVDETVLSTATLDDNFTDCTVIVTMTRQASLNLREHQISDFSEIGFTEIKNLSYAVEANVREQFYERQYEERSNFSDSHYGLMRENVDVEDFRQIISLTLREPSRENVLDAIRILEQRDDVFAVSPNWVVKPGSLVNMRGQAAVTRVSLPQAWSITHGSADITVGIMDTGVDITHPDLAGRMHPANSILHRDFTGSSISPLVDHGFPHRWNGHGTHVAGIVGPMTAWNIRMASLRVFCTVTGSASFRSVLDAIDHAMAMNIDILNFSANGFPHDATLAQRLRDFNRPFVSSAGNDNLHLTPTSNHIGRASIPNLIVVGASNSANDNRASFANHGAAVVCIFAPGVSILSTVPSSVHSSRYVSWNGSSMAAPMVAGVAALMLSLNPNLNGRTLRNILMYTTRRGASCIRSGSVSGGIVNAHEAVRLVPQVTNGYVNFVSRAGELHAIRHNPNRKFILTNDIDLRYLASDLDDMSPFVAWMPINLFSGTLDGNGFTIYNMWMTIPTMQFGQVTNFGLFSALIGTVQNLTISDARINGSAFHTGAWTHAGVLAGVTNGAIIDNVAIRNSVVNIQRQGSTIGGLVGRADASEITNSMVENTNISGSGYMGGVIGQLEGSTISESSVNHVTVALFVHTNNRSAGGIVGLARASSLITLATVNNSLIRFDGHSNISNRDLRPSIGIVVGTLDRSSIFWVGMSNTTINRGNLRTYRWGLFNNNSNNQAQHVGNGPWGVFGRTVGTVSVV